MDPIVRLLQNFIIFFRRETFETRGLPKNYATRFAHVSEKLHEHLSNYSYKRPSICNTLDIVKEVVYSSPLKSFPFVKLGNLSDIGVDKVAYPGLFPSKKMLCNCLDVGVE